MSAPIWTELIDIGIDLSLTLSLGVGAVVFIADPIPYLTCTSLGCYFCLETLEGTSRIVQIWRTR